MMTPKEMAERLDGREYGVAVTNADVEVADGLVIVYGASDDLVEIDGEIFDEVAAYNGTSFRIGPDGVVRNHCEALEGCPYHESQPEFTTARIIRAVWTDESQETPAWTYETDIPHETFDLFEDGDVYCRGIVFRVDDLRPVCQKGQIDHAVKLARDLQRETLHGPVPLQTTMDLVIGILAMADTDTDGKPGD
jgi:hypothetical protein